MHSTFIRRFCLVVMFCFALSTQAFTQLNHFIYLQTDNQKPFYLKYNNRIFSSSATGYLILSKLKDGKIDLTIGFPKSDLSEQMFQCTIDNADRGYLIKNFNEKGWGLYDLQTSVILYAAAGTETKTNTNAVATVQTVKDDPFANMLSQVTQDSTVKTVTVKKEEKPVLVDTPKPAPVIATQQKQKDTIKTEAVSQPVKINEPPVVVEPAWIAPAKSSVEQIGKYPSREGNDFVFEVKNSVGEKDTIRLFIALDTTFIQESVQSPVLPVVVKTDTIVPLKQDTLLQVKEEKKEKPSEPVVQQKEPQKEEVKPPVTIVNEQKSEVKLLPNSNCKATANEDDFIKLRRKMAGESNDEAMVNVAKKIFRTKCFSTEQIRNLAVLFLNDEGRYRFYDAAMLFVTDFGNFKQLEETIHDDYYKKRFIALLPNQ